jgi:hypothetical protein
MQAPMGTGGHCHAAVCRQRSDSHGSDLHLFRGRMEVWDTTKAVKDKMSAVVKKARSILALHPRDCSSDVLYGTLGPPGVLIDAAKLCWQHRCQNMEGPMAQEALRFSFEGSRGVGRPVHGLVR